jgi:sugar phosphate isomerase/epimerase
MELPSRRDFGRALALAAGAATWAGAGGPTFAGTRRLHRIGLITGTIGKALQTDFVGTIKKVASVGYRELEFGQQKGMPDKDFKKLLDDLGICAVAGGSARKQLEDGLEPFLEASHLFGKKYVVCYWPWLDSGKNKTIDDWKRLCDDMNRIGARVKAGGLRFAYHNHDIEFQITEGQIPYDVVLAGTDPDVVDMELDLYWITKGGQDAVAYLKKHPGRFALFHVKDMDAGAEHGKACPGQGTIDFRPMLAEGARAGVRHFIVENEGVADPLPCIERSYAYLSQLRY